jgi:hypothetical protein
MKPAHALGPEVRVARNSLLRAARFWGKVGAAREVGDSAPLAPKETAMHSEGLCAEYRAYTSSLDETLRLYARFAPLPRPAPLLLSMHGWHGAVKSEHKDNVPTPPTQVFFVVSPEMRGRGDSQGKPDANGLELQDAVDALGAARLLYPRAVADLPPRLQGGSGGGGNVLGIVGKFPDLFTAAICECGISDYALWYRHDTVGEFRDELKDAGWIGGDPAGNPEAYLSRGGRTTAMNLLTPLLIVHGTVDPRVPFEQAQAYSDALSAHGKAHLLTMFALPGVGTPGHFGGMTEEMAARRTALRAEHWQQHVRAPELPAAGTFVVAGFLVTRRFTVRLESADQVALLDYDLDHSRFALWAPSCRLAQLRVEGETTHRAVPCQPMSLPEFRNRIAVPESD